MESHFMRTENPINFFNGSQNVSNFSNNKQNTPKSQAINLFPKEDEIKKEILKTNLKYLFFYSLSVTIAVSISNVLISIMDSFPKGKQITFKIIYILILISLTAYITFILGERLSK